MTKSTNQKTIRLSAEWEEQKCIWLSWPENLVNWGDRPEIIPLYLEWIHLCLRYQNVNLCISVSAISEELKALQSKATHRLEFVDIPRNDLWIRDYGPFFVKTEEETTEGVGFTFNAWGEKYPPWEIDNDAAKAICRHNSQAFTKHKLILEGGALECDGAGHGITTLPCLVGSKRNILSPSQGLDAISETVKQELGLTHLLILNDGLEGDHTDGHIDNLLRFIAPNDLVLSWTNDSTLRDYYTCRETERLITAFAQSIGVDWKIHHIPLPPLKHLEHKESKELLPRNYVNFVFLNGAVILPAFGEEEDDVALEKMKALLPHFDIHQLNCSTLIEEGGALHCASHQEPA